MDITNHNAVLSDQETHKIACILFRSSLLDLERGIQGLVVMSTELEEIFTCIHDARVPPLWEKVK